MKHKVYCRQCRYYKGPCEYGHATCTAFKSRIDLPTHWYFAFPDAHKINTNNQCPVWEERFSMSKAFFSAIERMRYHIMHSYTPKQHAQLDELVNIYVNDQGETQTMGQELSLEEDVARIIKRIKDAKEAEALSKKADEVIAKLKAEL